MDEYTREYYRKVQFWGMLTLALGIMSCFLYALYLSFVRGYHPGWDKILTSLLSIGAIMGHNWIAVADTMTYILLMGPAASYVSVLSGNVKNMKLPSVLSTLASLGIEPGTPKADILSTFCVIASTVVNTLCLILLATMGGTLLKFLPQSIFGMIQYIVPAMFGAIFTQFALMNYKAAAVSLVVAAVIINIGGIPVFLKTLSTIIITVILYLTLQKLKKQKDRDEP